MKHFQEISDGFMIDVTHFKDFIRGIVNVPNFMKNVLGYGEADGFIYHLNEFLRMHQCQSRSCENLTLLKCSRCKLSRYCSRRCQANDYSEHQRICPKLYEMFCKDRKREKVAEVYLENQLGAKWATDIAENKKL